MNPVRDTCRALLAACALAAGASAQGPGEVELSVWNDPAFRKQFALSYMAETDVEPRVTSKDDREVLEEVLELIGAERMDEAAALLEEEAGETASAVFDFTLGNIHFQAERLDEASVAYETAVGKFPRFRRAWKNLGLIRVRQGDFEGAAPALSRVVELGGGDAVTYGLLGFAWASQDRQLPAETAYRMAVLLDPATMDWKMGLARSLFKQERFADAATLCGQLIAEQPERADLWLLQANAFLGLQRPLDAAGNYEMVERLGGSTFDSLCMLGDIYVNEELHDLAADRYIAAMELAPGAGPARALRAAKVLAQRGGIEQTRRLADRIEALHGAALTDVDRKDLLKLRARLAVATGAGEEEAALLREIVALDPLDGDALILLGQHASRAGDAEKAVFWFERAEGLESHEADARVRHAQLLVGQGRYAEALPLLRRAQQVNPRENIAEYLEQVERVAQAR
jgi:tetratricopeptide (TPR) repeat protein